MIFNHSRWQIWAQNQHPYRHSLSEFYYKNNALPFGSVVNLQQAMDWLFAVLYPKTKPAVETPDDLPLVGNEINDYRVVQDNGDGKAAAYRWMQLEGEASPSWHLIYDMDWGQDSILQAFLEKTQDVYVYRYGYDDVDPAGAPITGDLAGQHIYGGASQGSSLTLFANSGDGTGPSTGYVQAGDSVRPLYDSMFTLGTDTYRWSQGFFDEQTVGTLLLSAGSIKDISGLIDFDATSLKTSGYFEAGTTRLASGKITDSTGVIDFDDEGLTTTGHVMAGSVAGIYDPSHFVSGTVIGQVTISDGSYLDSTGAVDFGATNLSTSESLSVGINLTVGGVITVGDMNLLANFIQVMTPDYDLNLYANGTGSVVLGPKAQVLGDLTVGGSFSGVDGTFSGALEAMSLDLTSGLITGLGVDLVLDGASAVYFAKDLLPQTDGLEALGSGTHGFKALYLKDDSSGGVFVAGEQVSTDALKALTDIVGTVDGQSLFWNNAAKKWQPSLPDTEIDHGSISGLLDDDHTQYALLAGRSGGQTLSGGTLAGQDLTLQSTSDSTKGSVLIAGHLSPTSHGSYDLGAVSAVWRDLHLRGQAYGLRVENTTTAGRPSASASTKGRVIFDIDENDLFFDVGGTWRKASVEVFYNEDSTGWTGSVSSVTYTVTPFVSDSRKCLWVLKDNANDYEQLGVTVSFPSASQVKVTAGVNLPSGTYTLVGIG